MGMTQGDVYWVQLPTGDDGTPRIPHPCVVIAQTGADVVVCALTSNARKISMPGSVLLAAGEANLPRQSVVEVSKVATLPQTLLGQYIGRLSPARVEEILAGMRFVQRSFFDVF